MCLALLLTFSEESLANNPYQVFKKNRIDFDIKTNYFKSEANFTSDGSQQSLFRSNSFQNIDVTSSVRWELIEDLGLIGGFNIASSESSDALSTRKNSTLNRIDLGADYLFWNSDIHEAFVRLMSSYSLEKIELNTDSVLNSDGATEIKPEVVIRFNFGGLYPYASGGLNYRSNGLSMLATYAAGIEARFSEIGLGAAILGRTSIKDDDQTNSASVRDILNNRVNAGSKKYFAVNPNSTDLELNLNFSASDNLLFKLFGGYTLLGSNSAVGYNAGIAVNFNYGEKNQVRSVHKKKNKLQSNENLNTISREPTPNDFKEDTNDGVNQEYFKPVAPVQKEYINQVDGSAENLENTTATDAELEQIQIKQKLQDGEYKIKLKKKK